MQEEIIDTLVIGAGQAGIAASAHLVKEGIPHIVFEQARIAESWRTMRWDSLVANGPAWHDRFPGRKFTDTSDDGFAPKEEVASYLEGYAQQINAPIHTGVEVKRVTRREHQPGFYVETSDRNWITQHVIVATGAFQTPNIPDISSSCDGVNQIHSSQYRNPEQLNPGGVLVVGSGSSGVQIADELLRSGIDTWLSVGAHDRPPRAYRQRDYCWWLGVLGLWDDAIPTPGREHVTIAVSGARGGKTIDFRELTTRGMHLVGMTLSMKDGQVFFADDLKENILKGDENYLSMLRAADQYTITHGLDLPEEPEAHHIAPLSSSITHPEMSLNLEKAGITNIIWATGFNRNYDWLQVDTFDNQGKPLHQRGVGHEPGIYFLGLPWLSRRGSSFIWGVWQDARYVVDQISIRRNYEHYQPSTTMLEQGVK